MADLKISELNNYTPAVDVDLVPIVDTNTATTKHITWANIKATLKAFFVADQIDITDADSYYTGTEVETALQEVGEEKAYADSPGIITGGEITIGTNAGTFKVAALTAYLRSTDSITGTLVKVSLAEQDNQTITAADTTYFVSLNYNSGSPTITLTETSPYKADKRNVPIGKVIKDGSDDVHYISGGYNFQDGVKKLHERAVKLRTLELDGGSVIAYSGTNNFTMTQGIAFGGINEYPLPAYNSATTTFIPIYGDGSTGFTEGAARNTIDYTHYDDGDGTLGEVGVSKYGCFWVYRHVDDGDVFVVYGSCNGSLAAAETSTEPLKPDHLTDFGILIGRIVAPQAGGSFADIQMVSDTIFTGTATSDHNQLGTLQGGVVDEYYHLTNAQHTIATQAADTTLSGYLTTTDWDTFNDKAEADQTFYIGTTQVAINRASAALTLAGLTLTTPDLGTPSALVGTNISGTASSLTAGAVTNATLTTALTVNTGTLTLIAHVDNDSVLTIGKGAVSVSGSNTGDQVSSDFNHNDLSGLIGAVGEYNHPTNSHMVDLGNTSGVNTGDEIVAIGSELDTGTDDVKYASAKAIKDSHNIPSVAPSTDGKVLTSNGTDWVSEAIPADATKLSLSGGTMTGAIQLGETSIKLDAVLSGDAKWSGTTMSGTLGATIAFGDLMYLNANDSRWELVDANLSDGYDKMLGICLDAGDDGDATEILLQGKVRAAVFPAFTVGSVLYMSETAGDLTHTQPSTADVCIRTLGHAVTAEDLYFNPSNDYIVHTG